MQNRFPGAGDPKVHASRGWLRVGTLLFVGAGCTNAGTEKEPVESAETDSADSGAVDSGVLGEAPVDEGFEAELSRWAIYYDDEWGHGWRLQGANDAGDVMIKANQLGPPAWEVDTTYSLDVTAAEPVYVAIAHWPGADCWLSCDGCSRGPVGYRATAGHLDISVFEDSADIRFTDLVFHHEYGGPDISVPLIEASVPTWVCEDDTHDEAP